MRRLLTSSLLAIAMAVSGCGGEGGDGSPPVSVDPPPPPPPPPPPVDPRSGVAPYAKVELANQIVSGNSYEFELEIRAFDNDSDEAVAITGLKTTGHNLNDNETNLQGRQTYELVGSPSCVSSTNRGNTAETVLLFDRSGSIQTNDPNDEMVEAGREFARLVASPDLARIGQFTSSIPGLEFLSPFTSDSQTLLNAIDMMNPADGGTPLWDSMLEVITSGGYPNRSSVKALITFSDGEDTSSSRGSTSVLNAAQNTDTVLYNINLRNNNSLALDRLSLATGGLVWSTDEAESIAQYAQTIARALLGDFEACTMTVRASFNPDNANASETGYGPGGGSFKPEFLFDYEYDGEPGEAVNQIILPASPGIKIGETASSDVFSSDRRNVSANSCIVAPNCSGTGGPRLANRCLEPVVAIVCDSIGNCQNIAFEGAESSSFAVVANRLRSRDSYSLAACGDNNPSARFMPASVNDGVSPPEVKPFRPGDRFSCYYDQRFPASERPQTSIVVDGTCRNTSRLDTKLDPSKKSMEQSVISNED